jgi:diketogulonate reductase-like aldo/keto reductase
MTRPDDAGDVQGIRVTAGPLRDPAPATGPLGLAPLQAAGVRIPRIGFGTFNVTSEDARVLVRRAVEVGYRHIDTAMRYDNEPGVGQGVRDSSVPRDDIFVTTKFPHTLAGADDVVATAWASIRALGLDYVDLLLMHWPSGEVPVEETFGALAPLVADGVVRALGLSNAPAALVRRTLTVTPLANVQVEHHPYLPQDTLRELVTAEDMTLTAYAPFAEGRIFADPVLTAIGAKYGKNAGQVTLRWLLRKPRTVVIPKTARPERLAANLDVFDFDLEPDDVQRIDALGASRQRFFDPPWQCFAWDER